MTKNERRDATHGVRKKMSVLTKVIYQKLDLRLEIKLPGPMLTLMNLENKGKGRRNLTCKFLGQACWLIVFCLLRWRKFVSSGTPKRRMIGHLLWMSWVGWNY